MCIKKENALFFKVFLPVKKNTESYPFFLTCKYVAKTFRRYGIPFQSVKGEKEIPSRTSDGEKCTLT